jgi:hypothetical protein
MHVGLHRWVVVDSCVDTTDADRRPVAERYLRAIGVDLATQVDHIVATHWHADHVRGIGRLVEQCRVAKFSCAQALVREEFVAFVEQMSTGALATDGAKLSDFREALHHLSERGGTVRWAVGGKLLNSWMPAQTPTCSCEIRSLSPSDKEFTLFLEQLAAQQPAHGMPKRAAASQTPNLVSVVLHVHCGEFSILLGADMETHHDPHRGWTAATAEFDLGALQAATLLKVPHHGSSTGHHTDVWGRVLVNRPISVVTPFNRLPDSQKLPTAADVARIRDLSEEMFVTAMARRSSTRGRDAAVERSLRESRIVMKPLATEIGLVRSRRGFVDGAWQTEIFPPAYAVP